MKSGIVAVGLVCGIGGALAGTIATADAQQPNGSRIKQELGAPSPSGSGLDMPTASSIGSAFAGEQGGPVASARMRGSAGIADTKATQSTVEKARIR